MPQTDLAATERTIRWWHSDFGGTRRLVRHTYVLCCVEPLSRVQLFATLGTLACQAPLSMGFFRQEYWSGLSFPPPGDPPSPGIEPASPVSPALQEDSLPAEPPRKTVSEVHRHWIPAVKWVRHLKTTTRAQGKKHLILSRGVMGGNSSNLNTLD